MTTKTRKHLSVLSLVGACVCSILLIIAAHSVATSGPQKDTRQRVRHHRPTSQPIVHILDMVD